MPFLKLFGRKKRRERFCKECVYYDKKHLYCMRIMAPVKPDAYSCRFFKERSEV